jgi:predicted amidohydrolase YtcJ
MHRTAFLLAVAAAFSPGARAERVPEADIVLVHANVHTLDPARPRAQAVAISGRDILAVGSNADVQRFVGAATRVVDLGGRTLLPGFGDSHAHLGGIGLARMNVDLSGARDYEEVVARVALAAAEAASGEWIQGRGWHEEKWTRPASPSVRGFPTHAALSAVSARNPVMLTRADGHAVLVNAAAMQQMGIGPETQSPPGGEVVKDAAGHPTGILVDTAKALVEPPPLTPEQRRRALELAMDECGRKGVTSLHDAGADLESIALYRELAEAGKLRVRLYVMAAGFEVMRALGQPELGLGDGMLTLRAVKLVADGAMGSRGAALFAPYADDPGNTGLLVTPPERILGAARFALRHGFQVATHAIGDRANRLTLDAYERAFAEFPQARDPRFRIEHAQLVDPADVARFGRLGVIASLQAVHCPSDRPWAPSRIGTARVEQGLYVWRDLLATGARIANGTDAPVEDLSPIENFFAAVARRDARGEPPGGFEPHQRLTRDEALRSQTLDVAYASFEEASRGSLAPGKRADLVALTRDILTVPEDEILGAEVVLTLVDGRVVFER